MLTVIAVLCIFLLPEPIVWLTRRNRILGTVGAIACCYLLGFAFSALGSAGLDYDKGLTTTVAYVLVALSVPLILFSIDLRSVKDLTRPTVIGFGLCIAAVVAVAVVMSFVTRGFPRGWVYAAMTVGLYTGGTPNLNAIGAALGADSSVLSAANVSDTVVGGIYFLLLISVAPRFYRFLLGGGKYPVPQPSQETQVSGGSRLDDFYFGVSIHDRRAVLKLLASFGLAVASLGVGALIEMAVKGTVGEDLLYILLSVSVLGVALSFIRPVRETRGQYALGMHLVLMFSLALSMSIDWSVFLTDILPSLGFFACAQVCVIALHMLLCKLFGVDSGAAIITSTAGIYGPPFIAPAANAAGRRDLIAPGVICGALGLALGTFLGLAVAQLLRLIA